ncbi:ABC transporter ATP-binding protein [Dysgonomonas macrotermitis]|uniref:Protein involved in gliding motility GldA n=1 Tax=Dysgonomonas macrotermitis TaxID=1346286 RepID=A0A1M5CJH4_9BACT|nr:ATP-binding cassette domain-containing protein [Dysgonomonas macrotermitis]SHF54860.1 protein involved in gliding motility GldA [Dysgonomonas macrotermitis]
MIEICDISKDYGKEKALNSISFSLKKGEITAFLGPNGAGKTTLMNILAGVLQPSSGKILYDNEDISANPVKIKSKTGYLPEYNPLYEDMYVREYLEYAAAFYLPKKEIQGRVSEMIETTGLKDEYRKKIGALSYGNKKRVGLAQALIHNPDILILDEPTNGLDPNQHQKIKALITEISPSKIVLFSSHRFDDVEGIASHYLILNKGNLVLNDRADNIASIENSFYDLTK